MKIRDYIRELLTNRYSIEEGDIVFYDTQSGRESSGRVMAITEDSALVKSLWMGSVIRQWIPIYRLRKSASLKFW